MHAFIIDESTGELRLEVRDVPALRTSDDDILIRVEFSGVNYKDAMVASPASRVRRVPRLVGGVDAAGVVVESTDPRFAVGAPVAVHGGDVGVARDGGFAELIYASGSTVSLLPDAITTRDAMIIGTAGFTAMQSVLALEDHGLASGAQVLVTGATGGVGSFAVAFLAARGYSPIASTGTATSSSWLHGLGATRVIARDEISDKPGRVLGSELWDAAVDCVGGATLADVLRSLRYGGAVAASGLVASADLVTTVYPFITRGVALLGIDSPSAPENVRGRVWTAIADVAPHLDFDLLVDRVVRLDGLVSALDDVTNARTRGRILVDPTPG